MFDQHAFAEAVGSAADAIAQVSAADNEEGVDNLRGIQDMGVSTKRKKIHLLPTRERSRRLLFRRNIQDRAKARMGHLVRQGR